MVEDRRGLIINGFMIIGYADSKDGQPMRKSSGSNSKKPKWWVGNWDPKKASGGIKKERYWWVTKNNEIFRVAWRAITRNKQDRVTSFICKGCLYDKKKICLNPIPNSTHVNEREKKNGIPICYVDKIHGEP